MAPGSSPMRSILVAGTAQRPSRYICRACRVHVPFGVKPLRRASSITSPRASTRNLHSFNRLHRSVTSDATKTAATRDQESESYAADRDPPAAGAVVTSEDGPSAEEYTPATTWVGLRHVGHDGHWTKLPPTPEEAYEPWMTPSRPPPGGWERSDLLVYMYIAALDALPHKKDGQTLRPRLNRFSELQLDSSSLKICLGPSGAPSHVEDLSTNDEGAVRAREGSVEVSIVIAEEQLAGARLDFASPTTFPLLKRFAQLSKFRVPDPILNSAIRDNTAIPEMIMLMVASSRPKQKVAERLAAQQQRALTQAAHADLVGEAGVTGGLKPAGTRKLAPLGPNVMVFNRRETSVDREKEVGRWKIIERELTARGLPVMKHAK